MRKNSQFVPNKFWHESIRIILRLSIIWINQLDFIDFWILICHQFVFLAQFSSSKLIWFPFHCGLCKCSDRSKNCVIILFLSIHFVWQSQTKLSPIEWHSRKVTMHFWLIEMLPRLNHHLVFIRHHTAPHCDSPSTSIDSFIHYHFVLSQWETIHFNCDKCCSFVVNNSEIGCSVFHLSISSWVLNFVRCPCCSIISILFGQHFQFSVHRSIIHSSLSE